MPNKALDFYKVLAKYNKKNGTIYLISDKVSAPILTKAYSGTPYITYMDKVSLLSRRKTLFDFIYYYVRPSNDSLCNHIIEMLRAEIDAKANPELKILLSNKIRYAYFRENYYSGEGVLGNSCMRNKENQKALNFYIKNNVRIVVVIDKNNKIYARALLWENVKNTDRKDTFTFTYLDRVYAKSDHYIERFYDLAKKNKWKYYNSTSAGKAKATYYIDNINLKGICHLPYTDTFRYLYYQDSIISSSTSNSIVAKVKDGDLYVTLTTISEGGYVPALDPDRVKEVLTNNFISKKDAVRVKRYKGYVLKKNIVNINGDYYSSYDKLIIKSKVDGFILKENSVDEVISKEPIDKTKAVYSEKHKGFIHKANVVHIKDEIYHIKDTDIVCFRGKYYHVSDCYRNYDRQKLNEEIAKQPQFHEMMYPNYIFREVPVAKEVLIPKGHAIIAYDLIYSPVQNKLLFQEVYCKSSVGLIKLVDGTLIQGSSGNKQYLKKFNGKYYIHQDFKDSASFKAPNKKQLTFNFK